MGLKSSQLGTIEDCLRRQNLRRSSAKYKPIGILSYVLMQLAKKNISIRTIIIKDEETEILRADLSTSSEQI